MFLGKGALKIYSKFTGEHPCRSVNLLYTFRTPFSKNASGGVLLNTIEYISKVFVFSKFTKYLFLGHSKGESR